MLCVYVEANAKIQIIVLECCYFLAILLGKPLNFSETSLYGLVLYVPLLKIENSLLINYEKTWHREIDDLVVI